MSVRPSRPRTGGVLDLALPCPTRLVQLFRPLRSGPVLAGALLGDSPTQGSDHNLRAFGLGGLAAAPLAALGLLLRPNARQGALVPLALLALGLVEFQLPRAFLGQALLGTLPLAFALARSLNRRLAKLGCLRLLLVAAAPFFLALLAGGQSG